MAVQKIFLRALDEKNDFGEAKQGDSYMDVMSTTISDNLKKIRKEKKLSLDNVSEMTGVSKSMLGQIERGESSPTIATLWKIATGLHISFTALMEQQEEGTYLVKKDELKPLLSDHGQFRLYPMFPYEENRHFELIYIEMDEGADSPSAPHEEGTEEMIIVFEGTVRVTVAEQQYELKSGEGIRFTADKLHRYENIGPSSARMGMLIYYKM